MSSRRPWWSLVVFIAITITVSALGGLATSSSVGSWYQTLQKPTWTPPSAVFGPVWTLLYALMAIVGWRLWQRREESAIRLTFRLWIAQLVLNGLWSPAFFGLRNPLLGVLVIVPLWVLLAIVLRRLWLQDRASSVMWLPYVIWVSYAAALNTAIWQLN